ncbi:uncharacterized protein RSE6_01460 [Rhynchosporium secalis]|uniref:Uncharacterized protein n=1 Tax=Rhynchosporium secalis TaxID=38038 RepID=A0A1E1LXV5_RHYSE|nr:uncharacterized protein RSE6_01460 [Rhynchosporium secalis]
MTFFKICEIFESAGLDSPFLIGSKPRALEETLGIFLAIFALITVVFNFIEELPVITVSGIHILAYSICGFTDFPPNVAVDVLISSFVIIIVLKVFSSFVSLIPLGRLLRLLVFSAVAYIFVNGPRIGTHRGESYWLDSLNTCLEALHMYSVSVGIALSGIFVSIFKKDGYNTSLFRRSAAVFAVIRAAIQTRVERMAARHGEEH